MVPMAAIQGGLCVDVDVVRQIWNGAQSARCRFFCEREPCAICNVTRVEISLPTHISQRTGLEWFAISEISASSPPPTKAKNCIQELMQRGHLDVMTAFVQGGYDISPCYLRKAIQASNWEVLEHLPHLGVDLTRKYGHSNVMVDGRR